MFKKLGSASLESWDPWELDGPEFAPGHEFLNFQFFKLSPHVAMLQSEILRCETKSVMESCISL